jgi:hypothetical protein
VIRLVGAPALLSQCLEVAGLAPAGGDLASPSPMLTALCPLRPDFVEASPEQLGLPADDKRQA